MPAQDGEADDGSNDRGQRDSPERKDRWDGRHVIAPSRMGALGAGSRKGVGNTQELSVIGVTHPRVALKIGRNTMCTCSRGSCSEEGQRARRGDADDRHCCTGRARQIQMGQRRVVVDYIHARADRETGKLPSIVINVQDNGFPLGAAGEQPPVGAI